MVRGVVSLPNGTGKNVRVAVFARGDKAEEAKAAGADIVGAEDLMETVQGGKIEFDRCIATPDMMPVVGRLGKVLGPRNLMPNPKVGTVTMDVEQAVKNAKGGEVQFKAKRPVWFTLVSARRHLTRPSWWKRACFCRRGAKSQADRGQGHLYEEHLDQLNNGAWGDDRHRLGHRQLASLQD